MKKIVFSIIGALLALMLISCTAKPKQEISLLLWGSQDDQALLRTLVEEFKLANASKTYNIQFGVVGEPDAREKVLGDLDASADVFSFPNDQIRDLVNAGALYEITLNKNKIINENMAGAIDAVTLDGKMYGIPFTADNGYFLYYDSNFFSKEDVLSLDTMMAKAEAANKQVFMDVSNGWYIASFFLGAGNSLGIKDGKQVLDFNNATGVKVGNYLRQFTASKAFLTGDDGVMMAGANDGKVKAAVSGAWKADEFKDAYGDGYAATKLPSFLLDGSEVQMASFAGYKVYGINSATKFPEEAMALAEFLANESSQVKRFQERSLGPSNLKAAESNAVKADIALAALAAQGVYAHSQKDVLGSYWTPAEAFGAEMEKKNQADMQSLLDEMVKQISQ